MIDPHARRRLSDDLRSLVAGRITNDRFEERASRVCANTDDPAVHEIFQAAWQSLYSDLSEHRLVGRARVPRRVRREVARVILFLRTDLPYQWPVLSPGREIADLFASMLTLGVYARFKRRRFAKFGDIAVWPFLDRSTYEATLQAATRRYGAT